MRGDDWLLLILGLVVMALIVGPIMAIAAWVRVRRLEGSRPAVPSESFFTSIASRIYNLEQKVADLERRLAEGVAPSSAGAQAPAAPKPALPQTAPPAPPPPRVEPTAAAPTTPPVAPPPAPPRPPLFAPEPLQTKAESNNELESMIAGRWLNRIGITSVILAVAYFLKYAFDNQWIGPTGQVAMGILFGAGLLVFAHWLLGRGYLYFSEGIDGLGASVLYLSLWAACSYYTPPVISRDVAFVAMILVTGAILAIALGRDSQRIAAMAMLGGFLTPMLVSTGQDAQVALFTYLLVLDASLLVFAHMRQWRWLEWPAFAFSQIYFWGWFDRFYADDKLLVTAWFAILFFALFSAVPVVRARRIGQLHPEQAILVLCNGGLFLIALHVMLYDHHRWPLTYAVLALAAVHLMILRALPDPPEDEQPVARLLFAGMALTFVTLAIPIRLDGKWITIAWGIEAVVLMWSGFRAKAEYFRWAALVLYGIVAVQMFAMPMPLAPAFWNERFATHFVGLACIALGLYLWQQNDEECGGGERAMLRVMGVGFNLLALMALTLEMRNAFFFGGWQMQGPDASLKYGLAISLTYTVYAVLLLVLGMRWNKAALRWQALVLLGFVVVKVFFVDLSSLRGAYRIASFVALGLVLLTISFFYQRKLAEKHLEGK